MQRYKIPRYIAVLGSPGTVDDFPMTLSGKVQKYKLRRMAQEAVKVRFVYPVTPFQV